MKIALDYDGTYTKDPELWDAFIAMAHERGHTVTCVTARRPDESVSMPCAVQYTSRRAKQVHINEANMQIDIWIDDNPWFIFQGCSA